MRKMVRFRKVWAVRYQHWATGQWFYLGEGLTLTEADALITESRASHHFGQPLVIEKVWRMEQIPEGDTKA